MVLSKIIQLQRKWAPQIKVAEEKMAATKEKLETYAKEHENDTTVKLDKSNHEYYELRGNNLHAVAEVNRLRAQKSHDENRGISIFGVTVPYFNLVRDGLLILIAFISLLYTPMYTLSPRHDSEHEHDHPEHEHHDHEHHPPDPSLLETNVRAANGFYMGSNPRGCQTLYRYLYLYDPSLKILQAGIDGRSQYCRARRSDDNE